MVVQVMTHSPSAVMRTPSLYEGGVGADTMKVGGAINSSTIYGDSASATVGGDDSISIGGTASGSYIYANSGNDSVHLLAM